MKCVRMGSSWWTCRRWACCALGVLFVSSPSSAQEGLPSGAADRSLITAGQIVVEGRPTHYVVHHLPVNSFPQLPMTVQNLLNERGCLIPQSYEARGPENVIEASLERRGSKDWAVLCSVHGNVSLLVFFGDSPSSPVVLATAPETERLEAHGTGGLGFDWGIDPASPEQVRAAQVGMQRSPPRLDHDALADAIIDQKTIYHYFSGNRWTIVATEE